jgi:valyl-tRNA synthetase
VQGRDIHLDIKRVVGYRNFCNKLWQATRFMLGCFGDFLPFEGMGAANGQAVAAAAQQQLVNGPFAAPRDRWVLGKLNETVVEVTRCLEEYEFGKCVQVLDTFLRGKLCDVYLELIKPNVYSKETTVKAEGLRNHSRAVLWTCLDVGMRLLHPICPFVTEELWQRLPGRGAGCLAAEPQSIMIANWPKPVPLFASGGEAAPAAAAGAAAAADSSSPSSSAAVDAAMEVVLGAVEGARSLRADHRLTKKPAKFLVLCANPTAAGALAAQSDDFATLAMASGVEVAGPKDKAAKAAADSAWPLKIISDAVTVFVDLQSVAAPAGGGGAGAGAGGSAGNAAVDNSFQLKKLRKDIATLEPLVKKLEGKMATPAYLSKVPEAAQAKDRDKLDQYSKQLGDAKEALSKMLA